jgi:hypothetical protein
LNQQIELRLQPVQCPDNTKELSVTLSLLVNEELLTGMTDSSHVPSERSSQSLVQILHFDQLPHREHGYDVVPYDATDLEAPVDIVIAKLTDFTTRVDSDPECKQVIERFKVRSDSSPLNFHTNSLYFTIQEFERVKNIPLIDPVEAQVTVSNRLAANQKIAEFKLDPQVWENPGFCLVEHADELHAKLQAANINFPMMIKSVVACASKESHEMGIVFNKEQLEKHIHYPCMIQVSICDLR